MHGAFIKDMKCNLSIGLVVKMFNMLVSLPCLCFGNTLKQYLSSSQLENTDQVNVNKTRCLSLRLQFLFAFQHHFSLSLKLDYAQTSQRRRSWTVSTSDGERQCLTEQLICPPKMLRAQPSH